MTGRREATNSPMVGSRPALPKRPKSTLGDTHTPLRLAVTDAIRDRIADGRYPPGSRLYEEAIADELGVSRNPIREAFQVLAAEGFIEIEPRRGARVASIDGCRAAEIFEVRAALEGLVAELAATKGDKVAGKELEEIFEAGAEAVADNRLDALPKLNTEFHERLAEMADNRLLADLLAQLAGVVRWIYAERLPQRVHGSWHEHSEIVQAVVGGDPILARRLAVAHVESARDAYFSGQTDTD